MISVEDLREKIREIPDYPKQGLVFHDLSLLFADPDYFRAVIDLLADWARPRRPQIVLGAEERGLILGGALAHELGAGFVAARQPGILASEPVSAEWELEGGPGSLELPIETLPAGTRVFASGMERAETVTLAFAPEGHGLAARLDVRCREERDAADLASQLTHTTSLLRETMAGEHRKPNPADLSGVLTAGAFRNEGRRVLGYWPIERAFVQNVLGGQ